ncbi:MAG TPA: diadenylate cyclase [Desulfuromonadales bacterium]|nr:diadenylate cyclase [Desulfuromonadales bacterium]
MVWDYLTLLQDIRWQDLFDIVLAAVLIWFGLHALRTMRTNKVGIGLFAFLLLMFLANQAGLKLTVWILQGISAVIILVVVVVYQGEIRRILERLPVSLPGKSRRVGPGSADLRDILKNVLGRLAGSQTGALIVLAGNEPLTGLVSEGTPLDAKISPPLLLSIFDPNSPGHDGALIIQHGRAHSFGCRLPLSEQEDLLRERGTRHAAALGLSERTDAIVLVVSEETGQVSFAREGRLSPLSDLEALMAEVDGFLGNRFGSTADFAIRKNSYRWAFLEGVAGILISATLWLFIVAGADLETVTYEIPIEVQNIPDEYILNEVTPERVAVSLSGKKRNLFKVRPQELVIRLDGTLTRFGRQTYPITSAHLLLPPEIEVADFAPEQVRILVRKRE